MNKCTFPFIKRAIDILFSFFGLVILLPITIIISILVYSQDRGPIFFRQERIGKNGKTFQIFKFRTMVIDAEKIGDGLTIKNTNDSRITKIGSFLRRTSLDEIPQLINVLKGDMSLVGPRPPVTYFPYKGIENYPQWALKRFQVRPGITGLSQVKVRNSVSWDQRIVIDNEYVSSRTLLLDLKILFRTLVVVTRKTNIY